MRASLIWLLLGTLFAAQASAEPAISTDRPGQSDSPGVVSPGSIQIETGWSRNHDDEDGVESEFDAGPGTVVRIGLMERAELRLGWTGIVSAKLESGLTSFDEDGSGDASLGAKFRIRDERGRTPEVALLIGTSLPIGDDDFTSDRADPGMRATIAHTLTDRLGLNYNLGLQLATERKAGGDKDTQAGFVYTTNLGIGITERLGAFVELYGDIPASAGGGPSHAADGGLTYRLRNNLQLDLSGGAGLNDRADDWFLALGIAARVRR